MLGWLHWKYMPFWQSRNHYNAVNSPIRENFNHDQSFVILHYVEDSERSSLIITWSKAFRRDRRDITDMLPGFWNWPRFYAYLCRKQIPLWTDAKWKGYASHEDINRPIVKEPSLWHTLSIWPIFELVLHITHVFQKKKKKKSTNAPGWSHSEPVEPFSCYRNQSSKATCLKCISF